MFFSTGAVPVPVTFLETPGTDLIASHKSNKIELILLCVLPARTPCKSVLISAEKTFVIVLCSPIFPGSASSSSASSTGRVGLLITFGAFSSSTTSGELSSTTSTSECSISRGCGTFLLDIWSLVVVIVDS